MKEFLIIFLSCLLLSLGYACYGLRIQRDALYKEAVDRGFASWEPDLENYPPIKVFTWK